MISRGLKKATAVSFLLHMTFLTLMLVGIQRTPSFQMPSPYVVSLVAPGAPKSARIPPPKKHVEVVDDAEEEGVRLTPEPKIMKKPPAPKPEDNRKKLEAHKEKSLAALKARREADEYRKARLSKMESIKKLKRLKALGASKARVKVVRKPEAALAAPGGQGSPGGAGGLVLSDYVLSVTSLIQAEWVFLDTGVGNIFAIVDIKIQRNGAIVITGFEKKSGNNVFDAKALEAINRASPVGPPPFEMSLGVNFYPGDE